MRIAYVGPFAYPSSSANSLRVAGVSNALAEAGMEVLIGAGQHEKTTGPARSTGIVLQALGEFPKPEMPKWRRVLQGMMWGRRTANWIAGLTPRPDAILVYGTHFGYLARLLPLGRRLKIPIVLDIVEWYDARHLPGGRFGPFAAAFELSMRVLAPKADGVIAISRYLESYFSQRGCKTLRLPPLFAGEPYRPSQFRSQDGRLHLCYVGTPGAKDELSVMLKGIVRAAEHGYPLDFHLVGLNADELATIAEFEGISSSLSSLRIHCYGRIDNARARSIIASCDFMGLLRREARFSKAGFPSKVAESLTLGTPVLANISSDLGDVLIDMENSLIVSEVSASSFCLAVTRAARLDERELIELKRRALISSELFWPSERAGDLLAFFQTLKPA